MGENDYVIMLPSMGRSADVKTLAHFPPGLPWIAVEPQELETYMQHYPSASFMCLPRSGMCIGEKRNWLVHAAQLSGVRWMFMLEDDFTGFCKREGVTAGGYPKIVKAEWLEVVEAMVACAERNQVVELGLSQRQSNHFYPANEEVAYAVKTTEFCLFDVQRLKALRINYDPSLEHFEDFDITIQILKAHERAGLYLPAAFNHVEMGTNSGGHQTPGTDRQGRTILSVAYLALKYPDCVEVKQGRLFDEPRVNWKALRAGMREVANATR